MVVTIDTSALLAVLLNEEKKSPLDVKGVTTGITLNELNEAVRKSRERG